MQINNCPFFFQIDYLNNYYADIVSLFYSSYIISIICVVIKHASINDVANEYIINVFLYLYLYKNI